MQDAEAIKELAQQSARPFIGKVGGVEYVFLPKRDAATDDIVWERDKEIQARPLTPIALKFFTLSGLVESICPGIASGAALHIESTTLVTLVGTLGDHPFMNRHIEAMAVMSLKGFPFNGFMAREVFQILLQTQFVPTPERDKLLTFIASVKSGPAMEIVDDRVTQTVTTRKGVQMSACTPLPSPIALKPYRTFREIEQPESLFVFRARGGGAEDPPEFGLFEADGETWQLAAIKSIRAKLEELGPGIPILA